MSEKRTNSQAWPRNSYPTLFPSRSAITKASGSIAAKRSRGDSECLQNLHSKAQESRDKSKEKTCQRYQASNFLKTRSACEIFNRQRVGATRKSLRVLEDQGLEQQLDSYGETIKEGENISRLPKLTAGIHSANQLIHKRLLYCAKQIMTDAGIRAGS